jgi:acyl carrier protein
MKESIEEVVIRTIARHLRKGASDVRPEHRLSRDLDLRPLDLVLIGLHLEDLLSLTLPFDRLDSAQTVDGFSILVREAERSAHCRFEPCESRATARAS